MTLAIERPADPDMAKVDALYREERDALLRVALRRAPSRTAAEDAVQEAFLKIVSDPGKAERKGINPAAFATSEVVWAARDETIDRARIVPGGEAIERLADTAAPAPAPDEPAACMAYPGVSTKIETALASLTDRQRRMVQMRCLDGLPASQIAKQLYVTPATVSSTIKQALRKLSKLGIALDDSTAPPVAASAVRTPAVVAALAQLSDRQRAAVELRCFEGLSFPEIGKRFGVTTSTAYETTKRGLAKLKEIDCPALPQPSAPVRKPATKAMPRAAAPAAPALTTPAQVEPAAPVVAEVWLLGARPPISCLLVHADETTASRDLSAVSMAGAQREITGLLIGDGYRPAGRWVDVDPSAPEAMRTFSMGDAR